MKDEFDCLALEICNALAAEVEASRQDPSRNFDLTNGRLVSESDDRFVYSFRADFQVPIPPETPIQISVEKQSVGGIWIAQDDFDVLLAADEHLGNEVEKARVSSDPSFIIEELRKRLEDLRRSEQLGYDLPLSVAGRYELPPGVDGTAARRAAECLHGLSTPGFVPNGSQMEALASCCGSRLHFVWGPPGTGKTVNLAQVARALSEQGQSVLVLSHANAAVDVAMLKIGAAFEGSGLLGNGKILRVGVPQLPEMQGRADMLPEGVLARMEPDLVARKRSLDLQRRQLVSAIKKARGRAETKSLEAELAAVRKELAEIRTRIAEAEKLLIAKARILGATVSRLSIDDRVWSWPADAVLVDEISMVNFPFVFAAATRAGKRLLLFGDFRQLPPIALSKDEVARTWLGQDSFAISGVKDKLVSLGSDPRVTLLETQYRMHSRIGDVVSNLAYGGRLRTAEGVDARTERISASEPWPGEPLILVDTGGLQPACVREARLGSYSRTNPVHMAVALTIGHGAMAAGCASLGMITPYRAQAKLLLGASRLIEAPGSVGVATVHRFQGSERDAVIVDLVDAPPEAKASLLTGQDPEVSLRLLNVAISRPKGKLILLADVAFIEGFHPGRSPARALIALIRSYGKLVSLGTDELKRMSQGTPVIWFGSWAEAQGVISRDLLDIAGRSTMNLPDGFEPDAPLCAAINNNPGVSSNLTIHAPMAVASHFEESQADLRLMTRPGGFFALVGGQVAYLGGFSPHGAVVRIGAKTLDTDLERLYLGAAASIPGPSAEIEAALKEVGGRCPDCGEDRYPRSSDGRGIWVLGCGEQRHRSSLLDQPALQMIIEALNLRCTTCGGAGVARVAGRSVFVGCSNYARGCRGKPPSLGDLFGSV